MLLALYLILEKNYYFLGGLLSGLAVLLRYNGFVFIVMIIFYMLVEKKQVKCHLKYLSGFLPFLSILFFFHYLNHGFLIKTYTLKHLEVNDATNWYKAYEFFNSPLKIENRKLILKTFSNLVSFFQDGSIIILALGLFICKTKIHTTKLYYLALFGLIFILFQAPLIYTQRASIPLHLAAIILIIPGISFLVGKLKSKLLKLITGSVLIIYLLYSYYFYWCNFKRSQEQVETIHYLENIIGDHRIQSQEILSVGNNYLYLTYDWFAQPTRNFGGWRCLNPSYYLKKPESTGDLGYLLTYSPLRDLNIKYLILGIDWSEVDPGWFEYCNTQLKYGNFRILNPDRNYSSIYIYKIK